MLLINYIPFCLHILSKLVVMGHQNSRLTSKLDNNGKGKKPYGYYNNHERLCNDVDDPL